MDVNELVLDLISISDQTLLLSAQIVILFEHMLDLTIQLFDLIDDVGLVHVAELNHRELGFLLTEAHGGASAKIAEIFKLVQLLFSKLLHDLLQAGDLIFQAAYFFEELLSLTDELLLRTINRIRATHELLLVAIKLLSFLKKGLLVSDQGLDFLLS